MPTYVFVNTKTKKQFEEFMSISAREQYLKDNPDIQQVLTPVPLAYMGVGSHDGKTDNTWKEVMSKIAEAHPASNLANRYGKKSTKEIKTREAINKHAKKQRELAADRAKRK